MSFRFTTKILIEKDGYCKIKQILLQLRLVACCVLNRRMQNAEQFYHFVVFVQNGVPIRTLNSERGTK